MQKLLVFFFVLAAVYYVRRWLQGQARGDAPAASRGPAEPAAQAGDEGRVEVMRECAHCGLLIPDSEAVRSGAECFCCPEHARLGASPRDS